MSTSSTAGSNLNITTTARNMSSGSYTRPAASVRVCGYCASAGGQDCATTRRKLAIWTCQGSERRWSSSQGPAGATSGQRTSSQNAAGATSRHIGLLVSLFQLVQVVFLQQLVEISLGPIVSHVGEYLLITLQIACNELDLLSVAIHVNTFISLCSNGVFVAQIVNNNSAHRFFLS